MNRTEWKKLALMLVAVAACMILPLGAERFRLAAGEAIAMVGEYARSRVLQALVPALFIAGGIATFLYAGPAVSLPNVLVIRSVMGTRKTIVYCLLVVLMATVSGMVYQSIVGASV
jgi:uncharacterized membrane protein YraQ (UPF0718 family)